MRKTIFSILLMAAFLLASCRPKPVAEIQTATPVKPVEITWYVRSNEVEQKWEQQTVIPAFESSNPNIKINLAAAPQADFDNTMQTMVDAGAPPDIWSPWGTSDFADDVARGWVADLTPYIEKDNVDLSDFIPELLTTYQVTGKQMGLPFSVTGSNIFYNRDLFDQDNMPYPPTSWDDTGWTYQKFLDMCKALTHLTGDPLTDVYGCNVGFTLNDAYAWMYGKDIYPDSAYLTGYANTAYLNDPLVIQAFQDRQDIVWKYHYMPDPATITALGSIDLFKAQKVAVQVSDGLGWAQYSDIQDFKWGVAALPYGAPGRFAVTFTDPWIMSSKTLHPQESWQFLKYLISPDVQKSWTRATFSAPVRKSLLPGWYKSFPAMSPDQVKQVFDGSLKYGKESPSHLLVHFDQLDMVVSAALGLIINDKVNPAEALPEANTILIQTLKQIQAGNRN